MFDNIVDAKFMGATPAEQTVAGFDERRPG